MCTVGLDSTPPGSPLSRSSCHFSLLLPYFPILSVGKADGPIKTWQNNDDDFVLDVLEKQRCSTKLYQHYFATHLAFASFTSYSLTAFKMLFSRVVAPIVLILSLSATAFARPFADGALAKRATEAQVEAVLTDLKATTSTIAPEISEL